MATRHVGVPFVGLGLLIPFEESDELVGHSYQSSHEAKKATTWRRNESPSSFYDSSRELYTQRSCLWLHFEAGCRTPRRCCNSRTDLLTASNDARCDLVRTDRGLAVLSYIKWWLSTPYTLSSLVTNLFWGSTKPVVYKRLQLLRVLHSAATPVIHYYSYA
ncbi:hypothetical protein OE88DRAFT_261363 [Heliocybe sulcata]|uniref:Uncharacterized protein n=1 Tax=Heliocybe sulcata TaxID=5364 RepID=A0A5C3MZ49_9AGAM|nr:hypothetical protein OE88DRAFT_261363 [Heliocybe sulcata]